MTQSAQEPAFRLPDDTTALEVAVLGAGSWGTTFAKVLADSARHRSDDGTQITASTIIAQTATYFGLSVEEIIGSGRSRRLVSARQIAMYLCRELTDMPLIRIGEEFGGRDHTTVMHANKKISELMKERRAIFNQVTELTARIKSSNSTPRH